MLSIAPLSAGSIQYYINHFALEDGGPELEPGTWLGGGAGQLGLGGEVETPVLEKLFAGFGPEDDRLVTNAGRSNRRPAFDLTFSVPKSVSILHSILEPPLQRRVDHCIRSAVESAMKYLELAAAETRRGAGGRQLRPAGLVAAAYEHRTSRTGDPQRHTHCVLLNIGVAADGSAGALVHARLFRHKLAAGAVFRTELGHQLSRRYGLELRPTALGFELAAVSDSLIRRFSARRRQIEAELSEHGFRSPKAAAIAALATRPTTKPSRQRWVSTREAFDLASRTSKLISQPDARFREQHTAQRIVRDELIRRAGERSIRPTTLVQHVAQRTAALGIPAARVLRTVESELNAAEQSRKLTNQHKRASSVWNRSYRPDAARIRELAEERPTPISERVRTKLAPLRQRAWRDRALVRRHALDLVNRHGGFSIRELVDQLSERRQVPRHWQSPDDRAADLVAADRRLVPIRSASGERVFTTRAEQRRRHTVSSIAAELNARPQRPVAEYVSKAVLMDRQPRWWQRLDHAVRNVPARIAGRPTPTLESRLTPGVTDQDRRIARQLVDDQHGLRLIDTTFGHRPLVAAIEVWQRARRPVTVLSPTPATAFPWANADVHDVDAFLNRPHALSLKAWKHHTHQLLRAAWKLPTYKLDTRRLRRNAVLVIDSAHKLDSDRLARLLAEARRDRAHVVLAGRSEQPTTIASPFQMLARRYQALHRPAPQPTQQRTPRRDFGRINPDRERMRTYRPDSTATRSRYIRDHERTHSHQREHQHHLHQGM